MISNYNNNDDPTSSNNKQIEFNIENLLKEENTVTEEGRNKFNDSIDNKKIDNSNLN